MSLLRTLLIAAALCGPAAPVAFAQDADPKPRREPLIPSEPGAAPGMTLEQRCAVERREREKRRAQGLPVGPLNRTSPCRTLTNPPIRAEPPLRRADTPIRQMPPPETMTPQDRRRRNTTNNTQPPLR
jgi:hypothetical protein